MSFAPLFTGLDDEDDCENNISDEEVHKCNDVCLNEEVLKWNITNKDLCGVLVDFVYRKKLHIERAQQDEKWELLGTSISQDDRFKGYERKTGLQLRHMFLQLLGGSSCHNEDQTLTQEEDISLLITACLVDMQKFLPNHFKILESSEWNMRGYSGLLAGSSEITAYSFEANDQDILFKYNSGTPLEDCGLDFDLLDVLTVLYCKGIRHIYSLTADSMRLPDLLEALWHGEFEGASYVRAVQGCSVHIEVSEYLEVDR